MEILQLLWQLLDSVVALAQSLVPFDKQLLLFLNGSDSLFLDGLVKTLTTASTWIPLYVALFIMVVRNNDSVPRIMFVVACAGLCVLLAGTVDDELVKPSVARWRPTHDPEIGALVDIVGGYRGGSYGFFSAHASNTFSLAIFFSLLVRSNVLAVSLVLWSFVNCWTRMYLGVHFPGDILCGLLWGGFVGMMVYFLYSLVTSAFSWQRRFTSEQHTDAGYKIVDVDLVVTVLLLTVVYAFIRSCFSLYII